MPGRRTLDRREDHSCKVFGCRAVTRIFGLEKPQAEEQFIRRDGAIPGVPGLAQPALDEVRLDSPECRFLIAIPNQAADLRLSRAGRSLDAAVRLRDAAEALGRVGQPARHPLQF